MKKIYRTALPKNAKFRLVFFIRHELMSTTMHGATKLEFKSMFTVFLIHNYQSDVNVKPKIILTLDITHANFVLSCCGLCNDYIDIHTKCITGLCQLHFVFKMERAKCLAGYYKVNIGQFQWQWVNHHVTDCFSHCYYQLKLFSVAATGCHHWRGMCLVRQLHSLHGTNKAGHQVFTIYHQLNLNIT